MPENYKPLVGSAAEAMRDWIGALRAAKITSGPIFRRGRATRWAHHWAPRACGSS